MRFSQIRSPLALSLGLLIPAHFVLMGQSQCPVGSPDDDGDGWTVEEGDCNDADGSVYPGANESCDGIDNNCDGQVDEGTFCGGGDALTYVDTGSDDIATTAVYDFFKAQDVGPADFIYFSISGESTQDGAWCSERADWYRENYLANATTNNVVVSGDWNKWSRAEGGSWSEPTTQGYYNYFGGSCDSYAYSWCSEWGVGGLFNATMPADGNGIGESFAGNWSYGAGWKVVIRTGASRFETCGF